MVVCENMDPSINSWVNTQNLIELSKYVPLQKVSYLKACYFASKRDPSVIIGHRTCLLDENDSDDELSTDGTVISITSNSPCNKSTIVDDSSDVDKVTDKSPPAATSITSTTKTALEIFMLHPPRLLQNIITSNGEAEITTNREALLNHMLSHRNRHNYIAGETKQVSNYLDVEIKDEQKILLNPTILDTLVGYVMKDAQGSGAKLRLP